MATKQLLVGALCTMLLATTVFNVAAESTEGNGYLQFDKQSLSLEKDSPYHLKTDQKHDFTVEISKDGEYEPILLFRPADENTQEIEYSLLIDGALPFKEAELLKAKTLYKDDGNIVELSNGDQAAAAQKTVDGVMQSYATDSKGIRHTPYTVNLTSGMHTVTITCLGNDFDLYEVSFETVQEVFDYSQVKKEYTASEYGGEQIILEAEDTLYRNDYSLTAKSDMSSGDITPRSAVKSLVNHIGGSGWNTPGQEIAWKIEIPEDGLYRIGFSFKQNGVINGKSYRELKIDGNVPFSEASEIAFPYKTAWQFKNLSDNEGNDYLFYFSKGEHALSLTVTLAGVSEIYEILNAICSEIGELYLDIVMITGENPDANRDYELYKQIPEFQERLASFYDSLTALSSEINSRSDINGELDGAVKNMARVSKQMHDEKYQSHLFLDIYYSYYQTLSAWLYDMKSMPLAIDKIIISAPDSQVSIGRLGFFGKLGFSFTKFVKSFTGDYSTDTSGLKSSATIKIWTNWGRDQVKVFNTLIQESFSANTGINVKLEQVNASLVQGIISNNSPDLYLCLARTEPVNLAMRGVLYELSSFPDFEEVLENFQTDAITPYMYHNKCYALPDTQGFNVMFVRDDIFNELNLEIPETWQDFITATSVLQRNNMNSYLPYTRITSATTVNTGAGGLTIYPSMLMQAGRSLYNENLTATNLASSESVSVFRMWTDFYKIYKLNPDVNFYQRFRVGTIPLGISGYTNYLTFSVAAPEIEGKWSIHKIPGTVREDGTLDHTCAGSGTGCAIMKSSKNPEAAWEFIKWWVSADTQQHYSLSLEAILGPSGRTMTSNVEALSHLSWNKKDLKVILGQWEDVKELPEVPGSYYVSRSIDQAFWAVYNNTDNEKAAITKWGKTSDVEIARKIAEYKEKNYD